MRDSLLIYVNGTRHDVSGSSAFRSLSDYLRYDLGLTGTKVVCAEGDCGSCTVFIGRVIDGRIRYAPVTSCIQFLHQLDCTHIVTVEGLTPLDGLNPVQEAMAKCHGAQCGFCTPGIVVSMYSVFEEKQNCAVNECDLRAGLVGNLCRCTGYQSIVRAGLETDAAKVKSLDTLYPPAAMLAEFAKISKEAVSISAGDRVHFKPATVAQATEFKASNPQCTIISGCTDIGVLINKGIRDPKVILNLSGLSSLRGITVDSDGIHAGAIATIADLERIAQTALPEYGRLLYWFGSPPIKNAATIGGNIGNGSPIADSLPALYVLDAEIELTGTHGSRRVNINRFYTGYKKTVMAADELITAVHIPIPDEAELFKLYKVSRRKDLDISAFTTAIRIRLDGDTIAEARLVMGGVGPNILRMTQTESYLAGAPFTTETMRQAGKIARGEVKPISDVRGSADYRAQLAENILRKFFADYREREKENKAADVVGGTATNGRGFLGSK